MNIHTLPSFITIGHGLTVCLPRILFIDLDAETAEVCAYVSGSINRDAVVTLNMYSSRTLSGKLKLMQFAIFFPCTDLFLQAIRWSQFWGIVNREENNTRLYRA